MITSQLLERVKDSDDTALRELIAIHGPLVYGVAFRISGSEADAADVFQDVFIGLPEALSRFDGRNLEGWLTVMTRRHTLMRMRAEKRRYRAESNVPWGRSEPSHEQRVLSGYDLERCISALSADLREVYVLKEVEGLSHDEVARELGISVSACRVRLFRARQFLRNRMEN